MDPPNKNSPRGKVSISPLQQTLDNKVNKCLKYDLEQLEKVSSHITNGHMRPLSVKKLKKVEPARVDLNKEFQTSEYKKHQQSQHYTTESLTKPQAELQQLLPTKKYPFVKDEHVSVDELRNRVYHGTLGVVPFRETDKVHDLNVVMKGKSMTTIVKQQARSLVFNGGIVDEDEGIDGDSSRMYDEIGDFNIKARVNLNTPATLVPTESLQDLSREDDTDSIANTDSPRKMTAAEWIQQPRPAILPQQGHSTAAKMTERPKPAKKVRTHYSPPAKQRVSLQGEESVDTANMNEQELQQFELLKQVRGMVTEARQLTNTSLSSMTKAKKQRRGTRTNLKNNSNNDLDNRNDAAATLEDDMEALQEQRLLKSVEELITTIKSGQLIKEQELSNAKILDILSNVLDKDSLQQLEIMTDTGSLTRREEDSSDRFYGEYSNEFGLAETTGVAPTEGGKFTEDSRSMVGSVKSLKSSKNSEAVYLSSAESAKRVAEELEVVKKSAILRREKEVEQYLASLPTEVFYKDVVSVNANKAKLNEKMAVDSNANHHEKAAKEPSKTFEDKFSKNLHYFCMLEEERRSLLLLPDEMKNITRKFHTRDKYEHKRFKSAFSNSSISTGGSQPTQKFSDANTWSNEAAKRVLFNLTEMMNVGGSDGGGANISGIAHKKHQTVQTSRSDDSGIGSEDSHFNSWRNKADIALKTNDPELNVRKLDVNRFENMGEYSLTFLRPAPPKMSIKPARVREHLFPKYYSMAPPEDNEKLHNKKKRANGRNSKNSFSKIFYKYEDGMSKHSHKLSNPSQRQINEDEDGGEGEDDEEEENEDELEAQYTLEKLLTRQYHSETELNKLEQSEYNEQKLNEFYYTRVAKLARTLSDSLLHSKQVTDDNQEEYEFIKISSNFNEAMEEVSRQKQKIKQEYLANMYKKSTDNIGAQVTIMDGIEIAAADNEVSRIEQNNNSKNGSPYKSPTRSVGTDTKQAYFPKSDAKSEAQRALEAGRKYVLYDENKQRHKSATHRQHHRHHHNPHPLPFEKLDKVEASIMHDNVRTLARCESVERIKFPRRVLTEIDRLVQVPNKHQLKRRISIPNNLDFDAFKQANQYEKSPLHKSKDLPPSVRNNLEKEWTREIWAVWFDEVIPQLDGTGGRDDPQRESSRKKLTKSSSNLSSRAKVSSASPLKNGSNSNDDEDDDDANDVNGERKQQRIVKSPTPYDTYEQINLDQIEGELIKTLELEIQVLTERIQTRTTCFDLARRGALYRKLGFIKLALNDLNKALQLEHNYIDALWQRHLIYLVKDKKIRALEDLNLILKLNRHHAGAYLSRADLYAEANDVTNAINNYTSAIKNNPTDYQAFFKRGQMYQLRGDFRMAMDDFLTTTKLNPKIHEAWFKHGMNYYNNNNWHYAIVDFTEMIKHNPTHQAKARLFRGKCYVHLEEFQLAFNDFCIAIHLNPNDWESYYQRGCLLQKLEPLRSLQDLSISLLIENGYDNIKAFLHRGILYTELERFDEAIQDFQSALEIDKNFAPAYVNLGVIFMSLNMNYWKAIKQFNMAISSNPVYIRAYLCRAQAYRHIHDLQRAYLDYTKAIHLDPANTQIYIYRGQVIFEMGNQALAAFCVQHAAFINSTPGGGATAAEASLTSGSKASFNSTSQQMRPAAAAPTTNSSSNSNNPNATVNQLVTQQALVFLFLKNYSQAIAILDHELRIKPNCGVYNLLGRVFMKSKRWKEATEAFEKSIETAEGPVNNRAMQNNLLKLMDDGLRKELMTAHYMKGQCLIELYRYQDAYVSFDKVISMASNNAFAYYYRGLVKVRLSIKGAIQDFNRALAINPELFEAFLARACIYGAELRVTKGILNCNEAIRLCPKSVRGYLYRGALKYLARSYQPAVVDLNEAIRLDQTCALAYFNRALCFQQLKQYNNALKDYSVILMLGDYLEFKTYVNRALLYFSLKDYSNALRDFQMALQNEPKNFHLLHMIGVCQHRLSRYDEAVERLTEAFDLDKSFLDALISRGNVFVDYGHEGGFAKAARDYQHVLLKQSSNMDAHINLGYLHQMTGQFKMAWEQFSEAIQINPNHSSLYEGRSVVCLQMSNTDAALKDINKALSIKKTAELFVNRGVIYQFAADNVNAMRDYQSAILMDATYGLAYYNSANVLMLHRQYGQAFNFLNLAIEKCEMRDESTYQNRAIVKAFMNDAAGAFRDLCEAIKYEKFSAHIYMNRGLLLFKLENYDLAEKDLTTAIDLSPNDAVLYKLRADCRGKLGMRDEAVSDYKVAVEIQHREEMRLMHT